MKKPGGRGTTLKAFCEALCKQDRFLLASHINPEGDAIGSLIAVESLLRRMGKKTTIVSEDSFPERLSCLPNRERWRVYGDAKNRKNRFDALVVTDCPTLERIGKVKELVRPQTVIFNIDHHVSNAYFGRYNLVVPKAAASGEVVHEIFKYFKVALRKDEATALYVSLSTDTGSFKYSNTSVRSHQMAADLIQTGIDIDRINEELYATYSLNKIKLYSRLLAKVHTSSDRKVAWVAMTQEDLRSCGALYEDAEGFIDFLKYLKEVRIAFFLSEMIKGLEVKVSFRSKGNYDVNQIATTFGGGGHRKASGCTLNTNLAEAVKRILTEIQKQTRFK